jgi:hypothetical protein
VNPGPSGFFVSETGRVPPARGKALMGDRRGDRPLVLRARARRRERHPSAVAALGAPPPPRAFGLASASLLVVFRIDHRLARGRVAPAGSRRVGRRAGPGRSSASRTATTPRAATGADLRLPAAGSVRITAGAPGDHPCSDEPSRQPRRDGRNPTRAEVLSDPKARGRVSGAARGLGGTGVVAGSSRGRVRTRRRARPHTSRPRNSRKNLNPKLPPEAMSLPGEFCPSTSSGRGEPAEPRRRPRCRSATAPTPATRDAEDA